MRKKINSVLLAVVAAVALLSVGCKKGTFDINSPNPNQPSSVEPKFVLSAALNSTATFVAGNPGTPGTQSGNDLFEIFMGYWAVSGDYIPSAALLQYQLTTDMGASIWDQAYPTLKNLKAVEQFYGGEATGFNYEAIAKIVQALIYQRLVDIYNNIPYSEALQGGVNNFPTYDDAETVYKDLVSQLDSSVLLINAATNETIAADPDYDIMFGGDMDAWKIFANTLKLKILMNLTQLSGGPAYIQSELTGLTTADFIGPDADATISAPYSNNADNHQTPLWNDIGSSTTGTPRQNNAYFRATTYGVNFYKATNDPRVALIYSPNSNGDIQGRAFGSTALEHNTVISGIGGPSKGVTESPDGLLQSPAQPAMILSSTQSLFLQAEAVQRGYLTGDAAALYQSAIEESFRLLGVPDYQTAAATYTAQAGDNTNFVASSNPLKTIILQKWAALNTQDPLAAWDDWRRTGYPSDLPVSIYPGNTATHIPYRLQYPTSEYNYNSANVNGEGNIDPLSSKIFWMP